MGFAAGSGGSYSSDPNSFDEPSIVILTDDQRNSSQLPPITLKREENMQLLPRYGSSASSSEKGRRLKITNDPKMLKRLAQNREAARKSRLRKKAYIQQLESSRIKLAQLEQDLHRSRSSSSSLGFSFNGDQPNLSMGLSSSTSTSDADIFDMEYGRWLEEHNKLTCELRAAFKEQLQENELRIYVNNWLAHSDQLFHLKSIVAKTDSFHLLSGSRKSPAERCFLWIGGFRPSHLTKIILKKIESLSDEQQMGIYEMQILTQEGENVFRTD